MKHLNIRSFQRSVLSVSRSRRRRLPFLTGITLLLYHLYRFGKQKTDRKFICMESPRIDAAVEPYPNRWTHHVPVQGIEEIDEELMGWVKEAAVFAAGK